MTDRWDAEAESLVWAWGEQDLNMMSQIAALARRAYRGALERAAEIAARDARECPDHPWHSDAHDWCHASLSIEAAIRREIAFPKEAM